MKPNCCSLLLLLLIAPLLTLAQSPRHFINKLRPELARAKTDTTRARLLGELGSWYYSINADSALMFGRQAVELAQKTGNEKLELKCRYYLAVTIGEQNIPESMRMYLAVLQEAERVDYWWVIQNCYFNMGILQLYLDNYPQAITNLKQSRLIAQQAGLAHGAALSASEISNAFLGLHQPDSARHYLYLAFRDYPAYRHDPTSLIYQGRLETDANPVQARVHFQRCIQAFTAAQNWRSLAAATRWYSELLQKQQQPDSSIRVAKEGLQVAQRVGILRPVLNNSRQLAQVYRRLGQTDSAYKYQTIMLAARDSLFSQQKINQIQTTLIEEQQRLQVLENEKNRFASNFKIYGLLGLVLIALVVAGVSYRNDQQKQRTNRQLQTLNHSIREQKEEIATQRDHLKQALSDLQTTQEQLIQKEKLASLGELTAGIAHEIQNPLNFVNNFAEVSTELINELKDEATTGHTEAVLAIATDLSRNLQKISHHGGRASSIVKGMLEHSRSSPGEKQPINLNILCTEYFKLAYHGQRANNKDFNCELVTEFDNDWGKVEVIPQAIGRVLLNLFNNAFYAVTERQKQHPNDYQPTVSIATKQFDDRLEIRVKDNGTGIPESVKSKIFQPFFTTKPTGEGTGLGLSLSYDIITKGHGGTLTVQSTDGNGTEFTLLIPTKSVRS